MQETTKFAVITAFLTTAYAILPQMSRSYVVFGKVITLPFTTYIFTKFVGKYAFVKRRLQERAVYRQTEQESGRAEPKRDRYWQLRRCLGRKRSVGEDHDESLEAARNDRKDIQDFFTAVEWAFHFTLRKNSVPENLIKVMMSQSPEENRELLLMMARKLDIRFDGNSIFLISNLDRKRIAAYRRSGVPALYTVLPLAVVSAAENGGG